MKKLLLIAGLWSLVSGLWSLVSGLCYAQHGEFDTFRWNEIIENIRINARANKVSENTIANATNTPAFIPGIIFRDKNQAEFKDTLDKYLTRVVNPTRIKNGKITAKKYPTLLNKTYNKFGIPKNVILAFWGLESNYGAFKSHYQLTDAFLTLIYDGRREKFFTEQMIAIMKIADKNNLNVADIGGSWAGAMGHFQFIPTTLIQYGVDGNNDGVIDIINFESDAMFSAGNYLNKLGWDNKERIARRVALPQDFDYDMCDAKTKLHLTEWRKMGVKNVPYADKVAGMVCDINSPSVGYLAYPNFYRVKKWNNSNWYAIAVSNLSDELKP